MQRHGDTASRWIMQGQGELFAMTILIGSLTVFPKALLDNAQGLATL
jgi:hypothetical protein